MGLRVWRWYTTDDMDLNDYQRESRKTAVYPHLGDNLPYLTLGVAGEAGEIADKVKKFIRDNNFTSIADLADEQKRELVKECGDVLWYIAQIATEFGYTLEEVAQMNLKKLSSRKEREMLRGSGDNR